LHAKATVENSHSYTCSVEYPRDLRVNDLLPEWPQRQYAELERLDPKWDPDDGGAK